MRTTTVVILGLIFVILPTSGENSLKFYYVYSGLVDIKVYYCLFGAKYTCEEKFSKNATVAKGHPSLIKDNCESSISWISRTWYSIKKRFGRTTLTICELSVQANLLENTVELSKYQYCTFDSGHCFDEDAWTDVYWIRDLSCSRNFYQVYKGNFEACTANQNFIYNNDGNSLLLTEKTTLCSKPIWKTDYDGIFASESFITRSTANITFNLQSNAPEDCKIPNVNKQVTTNITMKRSLAMKLYAYEYPVNITVTFCVTNATTSCKDMRFDEIENNSMSLDQCMTKFCDSSSCMNNKSSMSACHKLLKIDLETNKILGLDKTCAYSDGFCKPNRAVWQYTDRCSTIQRVNEGYLKEYQHKKNAMMFENSTELDLMRQGMLCGKNVWYTYTPGLIVSNEDLNFSLRKDIIYPKIDKSCVEMLSSKINESNQESTISVLSNQIADLQTAIHWLVLFAIICVVCYIFSIIVNYFTLSNLLKRKNVRNKLCFMRCFSQSLTTHYICLSLQEKNELKLPTMQASQLYETVENELYNK